MSLAVLLNLGFAGSGISDSITVGATVYAFIDSRTTHAALTLTDTHKAPIAAMTDTAKFNKAFSTGRTVFIGTITDTHKLTGGINS